MSTICAQKDKTTKSFNVRQKKKKIEKRNSAVNELNHSLYREIKRVIKLS